MKTKKFTRQPLEVEGLQVTPQNMKEIADWCNGFLDQELTDKKDPFHSETFIRVPVRNPGFRRRTQAFVGDWVLKSEYGFKVYKDSVFSKNFTEVEEIVVQAGVIQNVDTEIIMLTEEQENALQRVEISMDRDSLLEILDVLEIDRTNVTNLQLQGDPINGTTLTIERKRQLPSYEMDPTLSVTEHKGGDGATILVEKPKVNAWDVPEIQYRGEDGFYEWWAPWAEGLVTVVTPGLPHNEDEIMSLKLQGLTALEILHHYQFPVPENAVAALFEFQGNTRTNVTFTVKP